MHLDKLIHTPTGRVIISIILGLGLASLFKQTCVGRNCIVLKSPPINTIQNTVYRNTNANDATGCFKYEVIPMKCDKNKKIYQ